MSEAVQYSAKELNKKIVFGLTIFLLTLSFLTFDSHDVELYLFWASSVFIGMIFIMHVLLKKEVKKVTIYGLLFVLGWMFYAMLVSPYATNIGRHFQIALLTIVFSLFTVLCTSIVTQNKKRFLITMRVILYTWLAIACLTFVSFLFGYVDYDGRKFSAMYFNRNTLAIAGLFFLALTLHFKQYICKNRFGFICIALIIGLIFMSQSTKGILGIILTFVIYNLVDKSVSKAILVSGTILVVFLSAIFLLNIEAILELRNKLGVFIGINQQDVSVGDSGFERLWLILEGLRVAGENLLTGVGIDNSRYHLISPRQEILAARGEGTPGEGIYSHNNYIEMLLNGGIPALILYYVPIFWLSKKVYSFLPKSRWQKKIRAFVFTILMLKLFLDIGMVSYMNLIHILILSVSFFLYYRFLKINRISTKLS